MYPKIKEGVVLRRRNNSHNLTDSDRVVVTQSGENYFVTEEMFDAFVKCDGETHIDSILGLNDFIQEVPECLEVISIHKNPELKLSNQIVETDGHVIPCRYAIWHLTKKCNMKCSHCYYLAAENVTEKINYSIDEIEKTAENLHALGVEIVRLSGGEISVERNNFELAFKLLTEKYNIPVIVNTNGWQFQDEIIDLVRNNPYLRGVQISLDGDSFSHNKLRGVKSYDQIVVNLKKYINAGIHVRVISMLTSDWMSTEKINATCDAMSLLGVKDWVVEVPSATGRWQGSESNKEKEIRLATNLFYKYLEKKQHNIKQFSFMQVFDWPMAKDLQKKSLDDYICSHDLGLISFGPEGVSYCKLFENQFGETLKNLGSMSESSFKDIWNKIATIRTSHRIVDNISCRNCDLFEFCQGGCPGQYEKAELFQGCDNHSRNLARVKRNFMSKTKVGRRKC